MGNPEKEVCGELISEDAHRRIRRVAFFAVVISTVAVVSAVITLPLLYNYVQTLQSHMLTELDYCKVYEISIFELFRTLRPY